MLNILKQYYHDQARCLFRDLRFADDYYTCYSPREVWDYAIIHGYARIVSASFIQSA